LDKLREHRGHEPAGGVARLQAVDLKLHLIAIRVCEVERRSDAVVDAPVWLDPFSAEFFAVFQQRA
jgi:hypothetical protein